VRLSAEGDAPEPYLWVTDFAELETSFKPILEQLDHHCLNGIPGLNNPRSENLARWIWKKMKPRLSLLDEIEVRETCTSVCLYRGE